MFIEYFGFKQNPFSVADASCFFYADLDKVNISEQMLRDVQNGVSPILLTGAVGAEKSALLQHFVTQLPANIQLITHFKSELNYAASVLTRIDKLAEIDGQVNSKLLLIIDNAHDIPDAELKLLLLLTKHHAEKTRAFQMLWCGVEGLDEKLRCIDAKKYTDYVFHYRFDSLNVLQIKQYIHFRLQRVGYFSADSGELFSPDAIKMIFTLSHGIPKTINSICGYALGLASLDGGDKISERHIQEAFKLHLMPPDEASASLVSQSEMGVVGEHTESNKKMTVRIQINKAPLKGVQSSQQLNKRQEYSAQVKTHKWFVTRLAIGLCFVAVAGFQYFQDPLVTLDNGQDNMKTVAYMPASIAGQADTIPIAPAAKITLSGDKTEILRQVTSVLAPTAENVIEKPNILRAASHHVARKLSPVITAKQRQVLPRVSVIEKNVIRHPENQKMIKPLPVIAMYSKEYSVAQAQVKHKTQSANAVQQKMTVVRAKTDQRPVEHAPKQFVLSKPNNFQASNFKSSQINTLKKLQAAHAVLDAQERAARDRAASRLHLDRLGVKFNSDSLVDAAEKGNLRVAKLLLSGGIPYNIKNRQGQTALMASAKNGHKQIINELLKESDHAGNKDSFNKKTIIIKPFKYQ
ncbi:ankyrin repeat domain-containing protein [Crenothrix polyspora]|uniref:Uncharacterized protein n=1 Tax=Crenothrix polyspora TaxID=360316 RepID=A0A1R4HD91_9GAMM|nr:ankyrin repeat domain-containing protein [Crenothrix polyspora]SJM94218.1 hypothetical protein CRENPOLYSF1_500005 [Crenothrix polyspora]